MTWPYSGSSNTRVDTILNLISKKHARVCRCNMTLVKAIWVHQPKYEWYLTHDKLCSPSPSQMLRLDGTMFMPSFPADELVHFAFTMNDVGNSDISDYESYMTAQLPVELPLVKTAIRVVQHPNSPPASATDWIATRSKNIITIRSRVASDRDRKVWVSNDRFAGVDRR